MLYGLLNALATFNRLVSQLFALLRVSAPTSLTTFSSTAGKAVLHLRRVFEVMNANKLYAKSARAFLDEKSEVLGFFVSSAGVRVDTEKVKAIAA